MIQRIVKMTFMEENIPSFMDIFTDAKPMIESYPGCYGVKLWQDEKNPSLIFTYSQWENDDALQAYRNSDFFKATWSKTKKLFRDRPEAWSLREIK